MSTQSRSAGPRDQLIYFVFNPNDLSGQRLPALGQTELSLCPEAGPRAQESAPESSLMAGPAPPPKKLSLLAGAQGFPAVGKGIWDLDAKASCL